MSDARPRRSRVPALGWLLGLGARRARSVAGLIVMAIAVALAAATLVTAAVPLLTATEGAAARRTLTAIPADRTRIAVEAVNLSVPIDTLAGRVERVAQRVYGPAASVRVEQSASGALTAMPQLARPGQTGTLGYLGEVPRSAVRLTSGEWAPRAASGADAVPVTVPRAASTLFGIAIGDRLAIGKRTVQVTGFYRAADPNAVVWSTDPLDGRGLVPTLQNPAFSNYSPVTGIGPLLVADGGLQRAGIAPFGAEVVATPSFRSVDAAQLSALRDRAEGAGELVRTRVRGANTIITTSDGFASAVGSVVDGIAVTRAIVVLLVLLIAGLAGIAIAQLGRLLVAARESGRVLQLARGASTTQTVALDAVDAVVIGALCAALAPPLASQLYRLVALTPAMRAAGMPADAGIPAGAWVVSVIAGLAVAAVLLVPTLGPRLSYAAAERERARPSATPWIARLGVDAVAVVVAVLAALQLLRYAGRGGAVDPVVVLAPALILGAAVLLVARGADGLARLVAVAGIRARRAVPALVAANIGRRPALASAAVAVVAATAAATVFAGGYLSTWSASQDAQARFAMGAPVRVAAERDPAAQAAEWADAGIRTGLVARTDADLGAPRAFSDDGPVTRVKLLAEDGTARGLAAASAGAAGRTRDLPTAPAASGPALPEGTTALGVTATATASGPEELVALMSLHFYALVESPTGPATQLDLGERSLNPNDLRPLTAGQTLASEPRAALPGGSRLVAFRAVVSSTAVPSNFERSTVRLTLDLDGASATTAGGATALSLGDADWSALTPSVSAGAALGPARSPSALQTVLTVPDDVAEVSAVYPVISWTPLKRVPATVTRGLASDGGLVPGSEPTLTVGDASLDLAVAGTATAVAGTADAADLDALGLGVGAPDAGNGTVVVDATTLSRALVQTGGTASPALEWWSADPRAASTSPEGATPRSWSATELGRQLREGPVRVAIPTTAVAAIVGALLLGLLAGALQTLARARSRTLERAQLRALGFTRGTVTGMAAIEAAALALLGAVVGALVGLAGGAFIAPCVTLTPAGTVPVPDPTFVAPWVVAGAAVVVLVAAALLVAAAAVRTPGRGGPAALLREGDAG